jgi:hypothetical protein
MEAAAPSGELHLLVAFTVAPAVSLRTLVNASGTRNTFTIMR